MYTLLTKKAGPLNDKPPHYKYMIRSKVTSRQGHETIGNPGSLCVTRDITQVNYREHMRRSLGLKICWKMEIKIVETYHVASFCCPQYVHVVFGKSSLHHLSFYYEGKVMKTTFPKNYVYVLRTTKTRHMVSFNDFYFHFPANFQT